MNEVQMTYKSPIIVDFKTLGIKTVDEVAVGNQEAYKELMGEGETYEFINITKLGEEYPANPDAWTVMILTEEWAKSYAQAVNDVPKPLFIGGHADQGVSMKERAIPDGYIVGAMVKDEKLYLRNALPEGITETKKALVEQTVKEIKAKMLSTSTSDMIRYEIAVDDSTNEMKYYAIESVKGQSNALVEAELTGSEAEIILTSFKENDVKGEESMTEKVLTAAELFISLKNQIDSGRLALSTVAENLGIDLMTSKQKIALKRLNDAESKVGDISEFISKINLDKEVTFAALKEAKIKEKFASEELIEIATPLFNLKVGTAEEIDAEVNRVSELKAFKAIQGKLADSINFVPGKTDEDNVDVAEPMEG